MAKFEPDRSHVRGVDVDVDVDEVNIFAQMTPMAPEIFYAKIYSIY